MQHSSLRIILKLIRWNQRQMRLPQSASFALRYSMRLIPERSIAFLEACWKIGIRGTSLNYLGQCVCRMWKHQQHTEVLGREICASYEPSRFEFTLGELAQCNLLIKEIKENKND